MFCQDSISSTLFTRVEVLLNSTENMRGTENTNTSAEFFTATSIETGQEGGSYELFCPVAHSISAPLIVPFGMVRLIDASTGFNPKELGLNFTMKSVKSAPVSFLNLSTR